MKIFVTGSGSFLMSNYIRKTIYENKDIKFSSIDNCSKIEILNYVYLNSSHKFYPGDINDLNILNVFFELEKPDIVIHAAAETKNSFDFSKIEEINKTNINGTQNVINCCIKHNVQKMILISSDDVYGELKSQSASSFKEDALLNPKNVYGASKLCSEVLLKTAHEYSGLSYNILRLSNVYGPRQTNNFYIPKIVNNIINDNYSEIYGTGSNIRDWTHVYDVCSAINIIINEGMNNEIYNISSHQEFSNIEVYNEVCKVLNKGYDKINFVKDKQSHDYRRAIDSTKLRSLGWEPNIKFKNGIVNTINWIKDNRFFYR